MSIEDEDTELRDLVAQTLDTNGVLNKLRAELRANVFLALEEQDVLNDTKVANRKLDNFLKTDDGQLAISLVQEFLHFFNLDFTQAVLDPESGNADKFKSREELKSILNLGGDNSSPLLLEVLQQSKKLEGSSPLPSPRVSQSKIPQRLPDLRSKKEENSLSEKNTRNGKDSPENWLDSPIQKMETDSELKVTSSGSLKNAPPLIGVTNGMNTSDVLEKSDDWDKLAKIDKKIADLGFEIPDDQDDEYDEDFQDPSSRKSGLSITEEIEEDISIGSFADSRGDDLVTEDHTISQITDGGYDYLEEHRANRSL